MFKTSSVDRSFLPKSSVLIFKFCLFSIISIRDELMTDSFGFRNQGFEFIMPSS
jgi:hypothetical protein